MSELTWYLARAAGITAWLLVSASVVCGLLLPLRLTRRPSARDLVELHRFLGGTAVAFTVIHVGALVLDPVARLDLTAAIVPFASWWQPVAVSLGVVALWLLAAVEVTSLLRRRLPTRAWRAVHLTSYVVFASSTVHALAAGSDAGLGAFAWTVRAMTLVVAALTVLRVRAARRERAGPPAPTPTGAASSARAASPGWGRPVGLPTAPPTIAPPIGLPPGPPTGAPTSPPTWPPS